MVLVRGIGQFSKGGAIHHARGIVRRHVGRRTQITQHLHTLQPTFVAVPPKTIDVPGAPPAPRRGVAGDVDQFVIVFHNAPHDVQQQFLRQRSFLGAGRQVMHHRQGKHVPRHFVAGSVALPPPPGVPRVGGGVPLLRVVRMPTARFIERQG